MLSHGYPAYTTSCAWLGYSDQQLKQVRSHYDMTCCVSTPVLLFLYYVFLQLCTDALQNGWTRFKVKVGADLEDDIRRCRLIRQMIGPSNTLVR